MTPCDHTSKDLVKCVKEQMDRSIKKFSQGIPELNVPAMEPINIDDIELINPNLEITFKNVLLHGASNIQIADIK